MISARSIVRGALVPALALCIAAAAIPAASAQTAKSRWLDADPLRNWNNPNGTIPRGPKAGLADIRDCEKRGAEETAKSELTPETRQVTAAGWHGAAVEKRAGDTVFVFARNGVDGMCRPMDYQVFVFVKGRFAGTLAPRPVDSREDGSFYLEKEGAERFTATFQRYAKSDPLCCPSRISTVTYAIRMVTAPGRGPETPIVAPESVSTKASQ